jgi:RHS repeat-associated protein
MWVSSYTQATVIDPSGNKVYPVPRDTNGNYITPNSTGAIDTLYRVPVAISTSGNQTYLDVLSSQNTRNRYTLNYTNINVSTSFGQSGVTEYSGSIQVLSSVQLPNGTSYGFTYDGYGELATMTLPTGGLISYGYTNFTDSYGQANRWLSSRTTIGGTWSYAPSVISTCSGGSQGCQQQVVVTKPSSDSIQFIFTLNGGAWNSQAVYYDHSGARLASVANDYDFSQTCGGCIGAAYVKKSRRTTTLNTGGGTVSKKTEYTYDSTVTSLVTTVKDWNSYVGTPNATPDRETDIVYVSDDPHLSKNMLNLPTSITVKNAAGTQLSQTLYTYDRYDLTGLSDMQGIVQHDYGAFDITRTTRANVTTVQKWVSGSTYLTWSYWYDVTGQIPKSQDPAGNITTFSYADNFYSDNGANPPAGYSPPGPTNAYVTTTTLPIIGSQTAGYYFGNGGGAFSTDQNGATSYSHYLDPLNRLTVAIDAAGGWTETAYSSATQTDAYSGINDATPSTGCTSCRHDQVTLDGIGRKIRASLISDPDGATLTDTSYDVNGRPGTVSNPYRSTNDPTYGSTTSIFDGLDRVIQVLRPDGNAANIAYGAAVGQVSQICSAGTYGLGYPVLWTDEVSKKRLIWYTGFDKIIEVDEPNSSGTLNVATCYRYDALNNLAQVVQQSENRTYAYDGLSRLTSSSIPESGTTTFSYANGSSLCSGSPGNVCSQTDARGVTTTYSYDALNRITQKSYSDGTPTVTYNYDQSSFWGVTLSNTKGRLSHVAVSGNRSEKIFNYDAVGRVIKQTECLPSNCGTSNTFTTTATYDRAGKVATITYPSTRQVTYAYTNANRLASATETSMYGLGESYTYATGLRYAPTGALNSGTLDGAAAVTESYSYNNRLEPVSQQVGNTTTTFMNHSLSYVDGNGHNNGDVISVADNLNPARTQSFTYDPLNRLATATETNWALSYAYDAYGNLLQQNVTAGSAPSLNLTVNTNNQITGSGFSYDASGNLTADGTNSYSYNAANRLASLNGGATTYTYDYNNLRVRKDVGSTNTEYIRVNGNVIAEHSSNGWSDYIFMGSRRLARADDYWQDLRVYGTSSSTGQYALFYWGNLGALNNYTIQSGDKLYLWQYQFTGAKGGVVLTFTDSSTSSFSVKDQDGYYLNDDQTQGAYHARRVDLSSLAGKTVSSLAVNSESDTQPGSWIILYGQIVLVSSNGTVRPLYTGQSSPPVTSVGATSGESGLGWQVDTYTGQGGNAVQTTTYYQADHVGSARMMTSGNGYPIWQATFLPFGYEYNPEITVNHYKFAGYEHDDESGLENANDRMLSSQLARFTGPDPLAGSVINPQSLNKYSYAINNPLKFLDPSGAVAVDDYDWGFDFGQGGGGNDFAGGDPGDGSQLGPGFGPFDPGIGIDGSVLPDAPSSVQDPSTINQIQQSTGSDCPTGLCLSYSYTQGDPTSLLTPKDSQALATFGLWEDSQAPGPQDSSGIIYMAAGALVSGTASLTLDASETWGNPASLSSHFADHGVDFGLSSAEDYADAASQFLQDSQAQGFPTKIDSNGIIRTYDPTTNTFGAYNPDGTTRTFFSPSSPTYFARQPGVAPTILGVPQH